METCLRFVLVAVLLMILMSLVVVRFVAVQRLIRVMERSDLGLEVV